MTNLTDRLKQFSDTVVNIFQDSGKSTEYTEAVDLAISDLIYDLKTDLEKIIQ